MIISILPYKKTFQVCTRFIKLLNELPILLRHFFASINDKLESILKLKDLNVAASQQAENNVLIILADDDKDDREFFEEVVTEINASIQVQSVQNGIELMKILNEKKTSLPDILFLDLNMPGKNGKECLAEIKTNKRLKDLPVVIYSTSSFSKDIRDAHRLGANLYITKPNTFKAATYIMNKVFSLDINKLLPNPPMQHFILSTDNK